MHCGSSNLGHEYYVNTVAGDPMVLQKTLEEKDLGVHITSSLKLTVQCQKAANKAMSALRLLRSTYRLSHPKKKTLGYFLQPMCDLIWSTACRQLVPT